MRLLQGRQMKILPEAVDWSSISVRYNTGGVDVIEGALVTDGRGEVRPLLLVDHEGHHKEESDDYDDEQAQGHRSSGRLCGGKNGVRSLGHKSHVQEEVSVVLLIN